MKYKMEMYICPGKCKCGKKMTMRMTHFGKKSDPSGWMVYGVCKPCQKVILQHIHTGHDAPVQDRDFTIDYNETVIEGKGKWEDIRPKIEPIIYGQRDA